MIVSIKKPEPKYTTWADIKCGDVFSWGTQADWFLKTSPLTWSGLGNTAHAVTDVPKCSTLVVATKVEITP